MTAATPRPDGVPDALPLSQRASDVTVVMPAMNRGHTIARALTSISVQTTPPGRVVVVDDASTDDTVAVARSCGAEVIELPTNLGSGPARNCGIEAATTTWIAFLDSDDEWLPDHLENALRAVGSGVLVGAPGVDDHGRVIGNATGRNRAVTSRDALVRGDLLCTSGVVVQRAALVSAGLFRPLRRAQDLDMWIRTLESGVGVALGRPGFVYHLHADQARLDEALMRRCYGEIVDWSRARPWFGRLDDDRAWARWHWDDLRAAQARDDRRRLAAEARWFLRRPHTWLTMAGTLNQRRRSKAKRPSTSALAQDSRGYSSNHAASRHNSTDH